jgi:hypothetical protein
LGFYSVISALAATMAAVSALAVMAAIRVGARSEETLVVPALRDGARRER